MADTQLMNDKVTSIPLVFKNSVGTIINAPASDTYTAVSSSASLGVAIAEVAGAPTLVLTPKVQAGLSYVVTITDASGLPALTGTFDIISDPAVVANWALQITSASTVSQAVPTAPGP